MSATARSMTMLSSPGGFAITKGDDTPVKPFRAIYIGGAGDLAVKFNGDDTTVVTFVGLQAGTTLPITQVYRVMDATTATNLVGLP